MCSLAVNHRAVAVAIAAYRGQFGPSIDMLTGPGDHLGPRGAARQCKCELYMLDA